MMAYTKKKSAALCDVYHLNDIHSEVKYVCMF